ncbi:unnamed protein product, partial [Ectocarpus fasciculatus]
YVAWRVNLGDPLYTGVVDMNWPRIVALLRPIAPLPFDPWFPWRALDFVILLFGVAATATWLRRLFGPAAAYAWWLTYPLLYTSPTLYWFAGQPDTVMTHVILIAVALHFRSVDKINPSANAAIDALLIGVVMGIATLIKPMAICFAVALVIHAACRHIHRRT